MRVNSIDGVCDIYLTDGGYKVVRLYDFAKRKEKLYKNTYETKVLRDEVVYYNKCKYGF